MNKPFAIDKDLSSAIKGMAVILMVIYHYWGNAVFAINNALFIDGFVCVAMFAFVSGYAHKLLTNESKINYTEFLRRFFFPFYRLYLFIAIPMFLGMWLIPQFTPTIEETLYNLLLIVPNIPCDSWWYAFCFAVLCILVFPILKQVDIYFNQHSIIFYIFCICATAVCIIAPALSAILELPACLTAIYGHTPIVRTLANIPYYLLGYAFCKSLTGKQGFNSGKLGCLIIIAMCAMGENLVYNLTGRETSLLGKDFIICITIAFILNRVYKIKSLLRQLGALSAFLWLIHMPVHEFLFKLQITPPDYLKVAALCISIISAFLLRQLYSFIHNIFIKSRNLKGYPTP